MNLLAWIVVGLLAGWIARAVVRDDRSGCIYTLVVGVLGALIGGALMNAFDDQERGVDDFSLRSVLVAALGATLLLLVLQAICRTVEPPPSPLRQLRESTLRTTRAGRHPIRA